MSDWWEERFRTILETGDWPALAALLGHEPIGIEVPATSLASWGIEHEVRLTVLAASEGFRLLLAEGADDVRRGTMLAVERRNRFDCSLWLWARARDLTLAMIDRTPDARPFVRKMTIDRARPDEVGLGQWRALRAEDLVEPGEPDPGAAWRSHAAGVLDQSALTQAFFGGFRDALNLLSRTLVDGPQDRERARDLALQTMLRVVFLYFVQRRGLLNGDERFLLRHLREAVAAGRSFHDSVVRPLFFGALNTAPNCRTEAAKRLGAIPFLNGGLFEPSAVEVELPEARWPNDVWEQVIEGLLERYCFEVEEPQGDDEARAVDPEMLGRVFEGLMYGSQRASSGSFYTPRNVVRRMVDETLAAHVRDVSNTEVAGPQDVAGLSTSAKLRVRRAVESVTLLDPAVGTGAFLVEALHALREWRLALGDRVGYAATRKLIRDQLFGVDIQPTAVRLCELRLWLVLLRTWDEREALEPLPNLSTQIAIGNALLDPLDFGRVRPAGTSEGVRRTVSQSAQELARMQRELFDATGERKAQLRRTIESTQQRVQVELLSEELNAIVSHIAPLAALEESKDLFGEPAMDALNAARLAGLREDRRRIETRLGEVRAGRAGGVAFSFASCFAALGERGFDLIVTNPPWVRTQRIDPVVKTALRARYRALDTAGWQGSGALGIRTPFGAQPDLAAAFLERSLELLEPGGRLCALVPAKLFRSLHGAGIRQLLGGHVIESLEDLSEASRAMFDATTYPAIVTVKRRPCVSGRNEVSLRIWRGERADSYGVGTAELGCVGGAPGEPWLLAPPQVRAALRKVQDHCVPLGTIAELAPERGVFTGANEVFVAERGEFVRRLGSVARPFVQPLVTGRTFAEATPSLEILWCYGADARPLAELPAPLTRYFESHRETLESRSDHVPSLGLWQLFRVREHSAGPKVAWRDMAPFLAVDAIDAGVVALNTVYYIAGLDPARLAAVQAVMSSTPARAFALAVAERARGGWRRHFSWLVRLLPVPLQWDRMPTARLDEIRAMFGLSAEEWAVLEAYSNPAARDAA